MLSELLSDLFEFYLLPFLCFLFLFPSLLFWFVFVAASSILLSFGLSPLSKLDWQLTDAVVPLPSGRSTVGVFVVRVVIL